MKYWVYIVILTLLVATAVTANKHYKSCFRHKCQIADRNSHRCCRIGVKAGRRGYDCTVDTVIATRRHKLSFQQKTRSMSSQHTDNSFFDKVKKCKKNDICFECCCKHRRKRQVNAKQRFTGK